jgi:hypothetical protein
LNFLRIAARLSEADLWVNHGNLPEPANSPKPVEWILVSVKRFDAGSSTAGERVRHC